MKLGKRIFTALNFICAVLSAPAQGTIQNLGFESAVLVPAGGDYVQFDQAFPGWTGYVGGVQQSTALYNTVYLDTSGIAIIDQGANGSPNPLVHGKLIQGNFTAVLMAGVAGSSGPADTTLTQTGAIPSGTQSLQFKASPSGSPGSFTVMLGGQTLSLTPIGTGANYTLFGADVHSWAGQTAELGFTAFAQRPHVSNIYLYLDSIVFSTDAVPEPSTFGICAIGGLMWVWRLRAKRGPKHL